MSVTVIHRHPFVIYHHDRIGSTNDGLKSMMLDAAEFTVVTSDEQTAGKGRRDRNWYSSAGDGLYMSVLLHPDSSSANITLLSLTAAIAVAEILISKAIPGVDVKWPNDVLINDRKVAGVLVEGISLGPFVYRIVMGIGVNLNHRFFPPDIHDTATSVTIETGRITSMDRFRDDLLDQINFWYGIWNSGDIHSILTRYKKLSSYTEGKRVSVAIDKETITGITDGITDTGALRLKTDDGESKIILAGDVTKIREFQAAQ